jgi:hypothetical protein
MEFHKKRRQQFLTELAYNGTKRFFEEQAAPAYLKTLSRPPRDSMDHSINADNYADESFTTYMLRYTAGEPLDTLREDLDHVVSAFEQATKYVRDSEKDPAFPPLRFIEIDEYERVLQLIGLCFLLHRRDLLPRVAAMFDPSSAGRDSLYEDMLAFEMKGRFDVDKWYHESYRDLINTMYGDTDDEVVADFESYIKNWYKSLAKAPWHDSHLEIEDDMCAGYFGYWAIEAAAIAYLIDIDDSSFREHLVYPKDLVDYAKARDKSTEHSAPKSADAPLRVEGGKPCPTAGYWMTPAWLDSRRFFAAGEIMPIYAQSPYGATIWQWSEAQ